MRATWILIICVGLFHLQTCLAKLKLIQVVFRHAERNAVSMPNLYPKDPYVNLTYEPEGRGGLTKAGKLTGYQLGVFLRDRYDKFLGPIYSPSIVQYYASQFDRIMMSAELAAAGMFPPVKSQRWHPDLEWQPIPVWTQPPQTNVLYSGWLCSNQKKRRYELEATDPYLVKRQRELQDFFAYLSKNCGSNVTQELSFFIRQQLNCQMITGLDLPKWTKPVFPGKLIDVTIFDFVIQSYNDEMKKLNGGMWIRQWLNNIEEHLNSNEPIKRKAHIYAGHDHNVAAILTALNSFDYRIPEFNSIVMLELHEINDELYVKVVHKNVNVIRVLNIPGCEGEFCSLDTFKQLVEPILPDGDPLELCGRITAIPF